MTDYIELEVAADDIIEAEVTEQIVTGGAANLQTKSVSYTPTESAQSDTVTPDMGYDGMSQVNVSVGAVDDEYVGSAVPRRASSSLTASGATVTAPAGYYSNQASKSVQSGTAGTPTASKGAVSNHSVSVTPSVTNTEGYISGGTKTGTAVSVSASELVSGTKSITANGSGIDVTEYAAVDVAVPAGSPTLQNKTVHPSSSDQSITADSGYDGLGTVTAKAVTITNLTAANIVSGVTVEVGDADDSDRILSVTGTASGGGVVEAEWNDVCLWDYDGTCLYSYTAAEFANLSALPANPTHTGLTAQGWNWSLSDAKTFVAANGFLDIGQLYVTSDAKTHIKVVLGDVKYVDLKLTGSVTGNITLDWGDGSATETNPNTSAKNYTHTYAAFGTYDITIARSSGTVKISQLSAYDYNIFRSINLGSNVILDGNCFNKCFSLKTVSVASDCDVSTFECSQMGITCLVLPSSFLTAQKVFNYNSTKVLCLAKQSNIYAAYAQFGGDIALMRVSATVGRSGNNWPVQTFNSCRSIRRFIITDGLTGFGNANSLTDLNSLEKITIPDSVTAIPATSFTNVYSLQEVHMKRTTPPSLGNTSCFTNRPATFKIYVPYSADHSVLSAYQTASNWSSYSSSMVEESA